MVIAADTVVSLDGLLLAKPADAAENAEFLRALPGRTPDVYTGVAVLTGQGEMVGRPPTAGTSRAPTEAVGRALVALPPPLPGQAEARGGLGLQGVSG